jgi:SAM-dependent methyltransferase
MLGITSANLRHLALLVRRGGRPVPVIYESLGDDFPLALAPGWLNLGLWEGSGDAAEAPVAARRLVEKLAEPLPKHGVVLDVGNGLGAQDPVIANVTHARRLVAANVTDWQLRAGRRWLEEAGAVPIAADATMLPIRDRSVDGIICVEAAFHFSSRAHFFAECARTLRVGGVLSMSDLSIDRLPDSFRTALWGLAGLRVWGLQRSAMVSADEIRGMAEDAGLKDVRISRVGNLVIDPAFEYMSRRLDSGSVEPGWLRTVARAFVNGWTQLRRAGHVDYILLEARSP